MHMFVEMIDVSTDGTRGMSCYLRSRRSDISEEPALFVEGGGALPP